MKRKCILGILSILLFILFTINNNSMAQGATKANRFKIANDVISRVVAATEDTPFAIHYIDVGQGDCALILCDGQTMLIDGGEASASSKVYAYLKTHGIDHLNYIVASHAHADHVGGLSGALN